jgi:hypothetical protein
MPPERYRLDRLPASEPTAETVVRLVFWRLGDGWTLRLRREGPPGEPSEDSLVLAGPGVEWPWPLRSDQDVAALFRAGRGHRVVAQRRRYRIDGQPWDVAEYHWENEGLIVATGTGRPLGPDITGDPRYDEENLAFAPFTTWGAPSR